MMIDNALLINQLGEVETPTLKYNAGIDKYTHNGKIWALGRETIALFKVDASFGMPDEIRFIISRNPTRDGLRFIRYPADIRTTDEQNRCHNYELPPHLRLWLDSIGAVTGTVIFAEVIKIEPREWKVEIPSDDHKVEFELLADGVTFVWSGLRLIKLANNQLKYNAVDVDSGEIVSVPLNSRVLVDKTIVKRMEGELT